MASDHLPSWYSMSKPGHMLSHNEPDLSFDEVAKLFTMPIAEAANILGVATVNLKQICRENGLARWPYLKILAGKTVEDVKREAAKEKASMEEMAKKALQQQSASQFAAARMGAAQWQVGLSPYGNALQNSMRPSHIDYRLQAQQLAQMRVNVPSFLDETKHGFPERGLSSVSSRWWGNKEQDIANGLEKRDVPDANSALGRKTMDEIDEAQSMGSAGVSISEERPTDSSMPASILTRTRKKAADGGRKALGLAITRGYGVYKLAPKDEALLKAIFEDSFSTLWKSFVPIM